MEYNQETYIFTQVTQFHKYLTDNYHKLSLQQMRECNKIINKSLKVDNETGCKLLKEFCDKANLHDYYIF